MSNALSRRVGFERPIGIELTFIPKKVVKKLDNDYYHDGWDDLADEYRTVCQLHDMPSANGIHADPGCVEYPSPILYSWKEARDWYENACTLAAAMGLATTHKRQQGGMGHIHMSVTMREAAVMTADLIARPYLSWVFATPDGVQYCKSVIASYLSSPYGRMELKYPLKGDETLELPINNGDGAFGTLHLTQTVAHDGSLLHYERDPGDENEYGITLDKYTVAPYSYIYKTLEWRAFDAAEDWSMQEEHIAFYQSYAAKILDLDCARAGICPAPFGKGLSRAERHKTLKSMRDMYHDDFDLCVAEFKALIKVLNLPWKRYARYVDTNLKSAFKDGKRM